MSGLEASIRTSSLWIILRVSVSLIVGTFVTTLIVRSLTIKEYGIYHVLYSLIGYIGVISSFGIPSVFQRFIPEAYQRKEYTIVKQLVFRGLLLRFGLSILTILLLYLLNRPIGHLLKVDGWLEYFNMFSIGIIVFLEAGLLTSALHSLFLHKYSVLASTLYTLFRGLCLYILIALNWGLKGVLWTEVLSWSFWTLLLIVFYYTKFIKLHKNETKTSFPSWRYFRYGGLSSLNELGSSVLGVSTDFFIIAAYLGPGAVAFYGFADRVIKLLVNGMPHILLISVIRPTFFSKYAHDESNLILSEMYNLLLKIGAFCVFPMSVGLLILGDKMIVTVFKTEYLEAEPILWIMGLFTAVNIFGYPTSLVLQAIEKVQINFYSKIFAVYNIIAVIAVINYYGVIGVVIVTCSAVILKNLFCYHFARKFACIRTDWKGLFIILLNSFAMGILIKFLEIYVTDLFSFIGITVIGMVFYFTISALNKSFNHKERKWINRIMPKPVFVF